jgi:hypothetical protein
MTLARQTWILVALCVADLVSTIAFVERLEAAEANPLMGFFLAQGVVMFVLAKMLFSAGPLALLEWVRKRRPQLALRALNLTIGLYLGLYGLGVYRANAIRGPWEYPANSRFFDADPKAAEVYGQTRRNIERKRQAANRTAPDGPSPAQMSTMPEVAVPEPASAMPVAIVE